MRSVRLKWAARRAIVRAAERACYQSGVRFRGRMHPIYAKELARFEAMEADTLDEAVASTPKKGVGGMRMLRTMAARTGSPSRTPKGAGPELDLEVASGYREAAATLEGLDLSTLSPGLKRGDASSPSRLGAGKKVSKNEIAVQQAATEYGLELRREQMAKMISESSEGGKTVLPEFAKAMQERMTRVEDKLDRMCQLLMSLDPVAKAAEDALSV